MGASMRNQRLAALALCIVLLLDLTIPPLVSAGKGGAKGGGGQKQKGGGSVKKPGGGGGHKGGKGGSPQKGGKGGGKPVGTVGTGKVKTGKPATGGAAPHGAHPAQPAKPANPSKPTHPVKPAHPAKPVQPAKPAQPAQPSKPAQPAQPSKPAQPAQPSKPAQPAQPVDPAQPAAGGVPSPGGAPITYHGGPLMTGEINLSIMFYGAFTSEQKDVIRSFLRSLENTENDHVAAVHRWWDIVESYQLFMGPTPGAGSPPRLQIKVGTQQSDDKYSVGKVLTIDFIKSLFKKADSGKPNTIVVLFTASQVTVHGLCRGKCYEHGLVDNKPYLIVSNPEIECPGACAWPFNRLDYGVPQQNTVKPPNGNAGIEAMLINFASGLAATVTNPFNTGFFKPGPKGDPLEAGTACENIFGSGAVPGQTGKVELDPTSGGSYNAVGEKGMKFMLPAVWNPRTANCWTAL